MCMGLCRWVDECVVSGDEGGGGGAECKPGCEIFCVWWIPVELGG